MATPTLSKVMSENVSQEPPQHWQSNRELAFTLFVLSTSLTREAEMQQGAAGQEDTNTEERKIEHRNGIENEIKITIG